MQLRNNIYCSLQVSFATFGVYILTGNELTASKAFLAMSLFNIIRFPFTILPFAVISFVQVGFSYLISCMLKRETLSEGREGVKCELGLALLWTGKMGFTHWDWDLATGNGMNNYKMGMGFLFFSGLCSNILK